MAETGEVDDTINSWTSDQDSNDQQSHLSLEMKLGTPVFAKERWGRLKTTLNAAATVQKKKMRLDRGDSFLRKFSTRHQGADKVAPELVDLKDGNKFYRTRVRPCWPPVLYPGGSVMFYWLGLVTLALLYNLWTCIAREAFREIQNGYVVWYGLDGLCDLIYLLDIFAQFRTGYLNQGLLVYESSKLAKNYMHSKCFVLDIVSLIPLDFLQFYLGPHALLRFPRFLKVYRGLRFMQLYESRTQYPNLLRVLNLTHILFLGSHWFAAFYYLISEVENFSGSWSYPLPEGEFASVTRKYLVSLHWSTLTLTTIGDLPPPETNWQYVFVIVSYLIGVFIFATIVGQVGNVITNRNASRQEFERLLDGAKLYMQTYDVPRELQKRVQRWYDYVWLRGRLNCNDINSLGLLPDKLKTELALHVNLETLKKVTIFQKCRPEFLHDLMLKMKAYIFTPGDLICTRGEVARELFIIADGVVEIIGENGTVLTRMSTGDFFGEIGILNLDGGINRRTADVRSVGYSELFVLSRDDVLAALKDHPDAESIIRAYGQKRLRQIEQHREKMRSTPNSPVEKTDSSSYFNNNIPLPGGRNIPAKSHFLSSPALKRLFRVKFKKTGQVTNQKDHHVSRAPEVFQQEAVRMKELDTKESKLFDKPTMNYRRESTLKAIQEIPNSAENSPILTRTAVTNTNEILENEGISMSPSKSKLSELVLNILNLKRSQHFPLESNDTDTENTETTFSGNHKDSQYGNCSLETACVENHQDLSESTAVDSDISNDGPSQEAVASDAEPHIPRIFLTPASSYIFNTDETIEICDKPNKDDSSNLSQSRDNKKLESSKAENEPGSTISHYAIPVDTMEYLENLKITMEKRLMTLEVSHFESISRLEVAVQKQQELMNQILTCMLTIQEHQIKERTDAFV